MKCFGRGFLVFAVLAAVLAAFMGGACAQSADEVVCFQVDDCIPGNDYAFLLLKRDTDADSIINSSILYIDQLTAQSDRLEIAVVYPDFTACDVVIGGEFASSAESPRHLGTCSALRLPEQLHEIGEEAFRNSAITHAYMGEKVTAIGKRAFADCLQLVYVYIPDSVSEIAEDAFSGCGNLVIGCTEDSEAHRFAEENGMDFRLLQ